MEYWRRQLQQSFKFCVQHHRCPRCRKPSRNAGVWRCLSWKHSAFIWGGGLLTGSSGGLLSNYTKALADKATDSLPLTSLLVDIFCAVQRRRQDRVQTQHLPWQGDGVSRPATCPLQRRKHQNRYPHPQGPASCNGSPCAPWVPGVMSL